MKRIVVALIALALVFSFIGCDAMIDVMNTMGSNVAGVEKKVVSDSMESAKANPSVVIEEEDGSKTFATGEGEGAKTIFTVSTTTKTENEEVVEKTTLTFGKGEDSFSIDLKAGALDEVEAIITPSDISGVINGLKSGSKAEVEAELKKPADEESKKAAEGTQKVLSAIWDKVGLSEKNTDDMTEEEKKQAETINNAINTLIGKGEEEKELTQADVVVLTAITNVFFDNAEAVIGSLDSEDKTEEEQKKLVENVSDQAVTLIEVLSVIPSDMAGGINDVLG
ncbi:MAG: hypothetical protein MSA93_03420, partial [Spirochaetales bacterium]|nr:hypothetical protein [Spirochaetales bacterium]